MIGQFKQKQPAHKSKLIQRFNVSINSSKAHNETTISHRLNSSKDTISHTNTNTNTQSYANTHSHSHTYTQSSFNNTHTQQNSIRYRNHITFLQCRIQQHQATINKLHYELQNNVNNQSKLNAQIIRLQRQNKNMLNSLYGAQNKITEMEQQYNMEKLQRSIRKIDQQLSMSLNFSRSKNKNKCKTNVNVNTSYQDDNPQIIKKKNMKNSMKTSQMLSECQQPSFKLPYFNNSLKINAQLFNIEIKPNILTNQNTTNNNNVNSIIDQQKQKQLQLAIYHLRKQIKQQQKTYQQKLINLSQSINKISKQSKIQHEKSQKNQQNQQNSQQISKLQQKINKLLTKLQQKDKQLYQIQQKYQIQLKQAQQIVKILNINIREIVNQKDKQIDLLGRRVQELQQKLRNKLEQNLKIKSDVQSSNNMKEKESYQKNIQTEDYVFDNSQIKILDKQLSQVRNILKQKQQTIQQLIQKLTKLQDQLLKITPPSIPIPDPDIINQLTQQFTLKITSLQTQINNKNIFLQKLQQQCQNHKNIIQQYTKLQQQNKQLQQKYKISNDKYFRLIQQKRQQKQQMQKQIEKQSQKYMGIIRKLQGDIAEKEYIVNAMTQQMIMIKEKFQVSKNQQQTQTQYQCIDKQQNKDNIYHNNSKQQQPQINIQQLKQHFLLILKQKQQHTNILQSQLQKQKQLVSHFQKLSNQYSYQLEQKQNKYQQITKNLQELYQKIENYENQIQQNRVQIVSLKKNLHDVQEKQAFLRDYVNQMKSVDV